MKVDDIEIKGEMVYINSVCFTKDELQTMINQFWQSWNGVMCNLFEKINQISILI